MKMQKEDIDFIMVTSFRYCLGRRSYAPSKFKEILLKNLDGLSDKSLELIVKEIKESDDLGMDCDKRTWLSIVEEIEKQN